MAICVRGKGARVREKGTRLLLTWFLAGGHGGARTCVMAMIDAEKAKRPVTAYRVSF
jgi:hypothetical protein